MSEPHSVERANLGGERIPVGGVELDGDTRSVRRCDAGGPVSRRDVPQCHPLGGVCAPFR